MKTTVFIIALLVSCAVYGQEDMKDRINTLEAGLVQLKINTSQATRQLNDEMEAIKYNLGRYHSQHRTAYVIGGIGAAGVLLSLSPTVNPENNIRYTLASGAIWLTGAVIYIDAEKWMKRASIGLTPGGVKITF